MEKSKLANWYPVEVLSRAVRMVLEHGADHASQWAAINSMGLRYLAWHRVSERPLPSRLPRRAYLGWLHSGRIEHGIPQIVRYSSALNEWMSEDLVGGLDGSGGLMLAYWAEVPRPTEAGLGPDPLEITD